MIRVYGDDLHVLREQAEGSSTPGLDRGHRGPACFQVDVPQIPVRVNLARRRSTGSNRGRPARGCDPRGREEVGDIFRDGQAYDVVVEHPGHPHAPRPASEDLPIDTPRVAMCCSGMSHGAY